MHSHVFGSCSSIPVHVTAQSHSHVNGLSCCAPLQGCCWGQEHWQSLLLNSNGLIHGTSCRQRHSHTSSSKNMLGGHARTSLHWHIHSVSLRNCTSVHISAVKRHSHTHESFRRWFSPHAACADVGHWHPHVVSLSSVLGPADDKQVSAALLGHVQVHVVPSNVSKFWHAFGQSHRQNSGANTLPWFAQISSVREHWLVSPWPLTCVIRIHIYIPCSILGPHPPSPPNFFSLKTTCKIQF